MASSVKVPNFAAIISAQPVTKGLPASAAIGLGVGQALGTIAHSAMQRQEEKNQILGFADVTEANGDPETASIYRSMANNMPILDSSVLANLGSGGPSSGGGRTVSNSGGGVGSPGGLSGSIMKDMMDQLQVTRQKNANLELDQARTLNNMAQASHNSSLQLGEIAARGNATLAAEQLRQQGRIQIQQMKDDAAKEPNAIRRGQLEVAIKKAEDAQAQRERDAEEFAVNTQIKIGELSVKQQNAATAQQRAANGAAGTSMRVNSANIKTTISTDPALRAKRDDIQLRLTIERDPEKRRLIESEMVQLESAAVDRLQGNAPAPGVQDVSSQLNGWK